MNLNKSISSISIICAWLFSSSSIAGTALIFDSPNLLAFWQGDQVVGFYAAENKKFSCDFLFSSNRNKKQHQAITDYKKTELLTFVQSESRLIFTQRDRDFDVSGVLYSDGDQWVLQTDTEQAGCGNAMGGFSFAPSDRSINRFLVEKSI